MKTLAKKVVAKYRSTCINSYALIESNGNLCMLLMGSLILVGGAFELSSAQISSYSQANYDDGLVRASVGNLFCLIEGAFGALIMVVAGLGAIVAAAMGAYRAAVGMLVVAVGAFILRSLVSLFFGTGYNAVTSTAGGTGTGCSATGTFSGN